MIQTRATIKNTIRPTTTINQKIIRPTVRAVDNTAALLGSPRSQT